MQNGIKHLGNLMNDLIFYGTLNLVCLNIKISLNLKMLEKKNDSNI
jgi:hypothetical protein